MNPIDHPHEVDKEKLQEGDLLFHLGLGFTKGGRTRKKVKKWWIFGGSNFFFKKKELNF